MKNTKYLQVYRLIKQKIIDGEYKVGSKIPSKRVMADILGVSTITIENGYRCLADEGYITSKERCGYIVSADSRDFSVKSETMDNPIKLLELKKYDVNVDFEHSVWFKTIRKVISDYNKELFIKSDNMGCPVLRNAISEYLLRYRGMFAQPERILISSGAERLYEIAVRILGRDKIYGIEDPSYPIIQSVYDGIGVKTKKLKMGKKGITTKSLSNNEFEVLHVTPFQSYPTGATADINKRFEYLDWAVENNGFIVEDDFNSEFFKPGNPIESLYSLDKNDLVIYINTFSKSISSSIRIGYMIIPEQLMSKYEKEMSVYSCSVPVLDQYILAEFISSGDFERHLSRKRRRMKEL